MKPTPMSLWDQVQLVLLRVLSTTLGLIDGLFKVRWGERLLERLTNHWQIQMDQIDAALARLETERQQLHLQTDALALHAAAIYLGGRRLSRDELCFDPANPRDEEILDASIEMLVKKQLATIETREVEPGRYVYYLEPDWAAIQSRLGKAAGQADPEIAGWFQEGIQFINEELLSETGD